jgi:hypothetical protein
MMKNQLVIPGTIWAEDTTDRGAREALARDEEILGILKDRQDLVDRLERKRRRINIVLDALDSFRSNYSVIWEHNDPVSTACWEFNGCQCNPGRQAVAVAWQDDETLAVLQSSGHIVTDEIFVPVPFWALVGYWYDKDRAWHEFIPCKFKDRERLDPIEVICAKCGRREDKRGLKMRRTALSDVKPCKGPVAEKNRVLLDTSLAAAWKMI